MEDLSKIRSCRMSRDEFEQSVRQIVLLIVAGNTPESQTPSYSPGETARISCASPELDYSPQLLIYDGVFLCESL